MTQTVKKIKMHCMLYGIWLSFFYKQIITFKFYSSNTQTTVVKYFENNE